MGWWLTVKRVCLVLCALGGAAVPAAGHGWMDVPASRNKQRNIPIGEPQSLPAGGPGLVYADGRRWPNGRHGLCGEPYKSTGGAVGPGDLSEGGKYATPPIIAARYAAGQTIDISIRVTAFHKGRFQFSLCKDPKRFSQACLDENKLVNADGGGLFYYPPGGDGQIPAGGAFKMRFKLPAGVTCDRCVLQWYWLTGNSCVPPGDPRGDKVQMGTCGKSPTPPEEFWNCADIAIGGGGGGGGGGGTPTKPIKTKPEKQKQKGKTPKPEKVPVPKPANQFTPTQKIKPEPTTPTMTQPDAPPMTQPDAPMVTQPDAPMVTQPPMTQPPKTKVPPSKPKPPRVLAPKVPPYGPPPAASTGSLFKDLVIAGSVTSGSVLLVGVLVLASVPFALALLGLLPGAIALVVYFAFVRKRTESFSQDEFEERLARLRDTPRLPDTPRTPLLLHAPTSFRRRSRLSSLATFAADAAGAYVLPAPLYHAARNQFS
jgi:hypothetical protein